MRFLPFLILVFLFSCNQAPERPPNTKIEVDESVNLIENGTFITYPLNGKRKRVTFREQLDFIPLFMGSFGELPTLRYHGEYDNLVIERWYDNPSNIKAQVRVDTTRALRHLSQKYFDMKRGFMQIRRDTTEQDWHPVYIENLMQDSIEVGYNMSLKLFIEAKDKNGKWRSINQPEPASCGVGKYQQLLPPKQYAITGVPIYDGPFHTKARIVFYNDRPIYSNEFSMNLNESQFTLPAPYNDELNHDYMRLVFYREIN